jgi:hypothetical protein
MARLNIEENFWTDPRFEYLVAIVGHKFTAIGMCMTLWRLGQECYKRGQPISDDIFAFAGLTEDLVKAKLAIRVDGGYQVSESDEHFGWLKSKYENGRKGGIKSGDVRRSKISHLGEANRSESKLIASESNPLTLTLTPTLTLKKNTGAVETLDQEKPAKADKRPLSGGTVIPELSALEAGVLRNTSEAVQKAWLKNYPPEFIVQHVKNADLWMTANTSRAPRTNFGAFFTRWIVKEWERTRLKNPSPPSQKKSAWVRMQEEKDKT